MTIQAHTAITPAGMRHGITGSTLKLIAIFTMLIDHLSVVLLERGYISHFIHEMVPGSPAFQAYLETLSREEGTLLFLYFAGRLIGRLAFPIFCFLIAEGFTHTRSPLHYMRNLGLFALISEIPFDLAFQGQVWDPGHQNVFFTLLIGALALWGIAYIRERDMHKALVLLPLILAMVVAALLKTDYSAYGILIIVGLYLFRENRTLQTLFGAILNATQFTASLAFIPLWFYNGQRGLSLKWLFYAFYPGHLLLLSMIHVVLF